MNHRHFIAVAAAAIGIAACVNPVLADAPGKKPSSAEVLTAARKTADGFVPA